MSRILNYAKFTLTVGISLLGSLGLAKAATPTAEQALKFTPVQKGVDFDTPAASDIGKCKITAKKAAGQVGWIVEDLNGKFLRRFLDSNGDNVVDTWCYYKDGIEVYRDIDANFNGKADNYRWFNTGGTRWGLDTNEDGILDSWKCISAEETTAEIVAALAARDSDRFARVAVAAEELPSLGLGKTKSDELAEKITKLKADFQQLATKQKTVDPQTVWEQFSANKPGVVPAGTDESTKDIRVYENVVAIVQTADKHTQMQIGTLVQVGDCWKAIDVPREPGEGGNDAVAGGFFFQSPLRAEGDSQAVGGDDMQKLLAALDDLDKTASQLTTPEQQAAYTLKRAELLEKIANCAKTGEDRASWIHQLTDMISAAVQQDYCPDGVERLQKLFDSLKNNEVDKDLAAYVKFRQLMAANIQALKAPDAKGEQIQAEWLKGLNEFLKDYPTAPDAAEAILQLAFNDEFSGQETEAIKKYGQIEKEFPDSPVARKASGARVRLESEGKPLKFAAQSVSGQPLDIARFRGKAVLLHFWTTASDTAKRDMPLLKDLMAKYGRNFVVVSVCLDYDRKELEKYLTENKLQWPQVFEPGGLESAPANQLGILTVPTMILIDPQGKVLNKSIQATEVEAALKKIIR